MTTYLDNNGKAHELTDQSQARFRPAVYVLVENENKELMLVVNQATDDWQLPGGGVDIGEDLIECGTREVREETGYAITTPSQLPFFIEKDMACSEQGDDLKHCLNFFFLGKLMPKERVQPHLAQGEDIKNVGFFSKEQIKDLNIAFWHKCAIETYLSIIPKKE